MREQDPIALNNTGLAALHQYWVTGQVAVLNRAIECWRKALNLTPPDSPDRNGYLTNLGLGLRARYVHIGDLADLEAAITNYQQAVKTTPVNSPDRPMYLNNLGNGMRVRYVHIGDLADLKAAITNYQQAVEATSADSPDRPGRLNNLGTGLRDRYARSGDLADLEAAITNFQLAVKTTPSDSPDRPMYLNNLGNGLHDRYDLSGDPADLEAAITNYQQAVEATPSDSPDRPRYLNDLGLGLSARYARSGDLADLEAAITNYQQAVEATSADSPDRPGRLNSLGRGLRNRYARSGDLADLEAAITNFQLAVDAASSDSPNRPGRLSNLGLGLSALYARSGDLANLEAAITNFQLAVDATPVNSPDRPGRLNNLGIGLRNRYARNGDLADLKAAITNFQQAVKTTPVNSPDRPTYLNNLGNGMRDRYARSGDLADLKAAITNYQQAVETTPPDSPDRPGYLSNLGNGLGDRYARSRDLADLEAVISNYRQAVEATPSDSPDRPGRLSNLGTGLRDRYARCGDLADQIQAVASFQKACQSGLDLALESALMAARTWGDWALKRRSWAEAEQAYTYGLEASDKLFQVQLLRASKEAWLRAAPDLHAHAAYAFTQLGGLHRAVTTLEQGHARLLSQVLERDRADLTQLETFAPEVYCQFIAVTNRLQQLEAQDISGQVALSPGQTLAEAIRQTRSDLDTAVKAIRHVPGYATFLLPLTFEQIRQIVQAAPLVYIAATPAGGLALIVFPAGRERAAAEVTPLWLKDLTETALRERVRGSDTVPALGCYLGAYARWRSNPADGSAHTAWHTALDETTRWLWETLMGPLVQALTDAHVAQAVLVPQGLLGLLPLHAAWKPDPTSPTGRRYVLDSVTFSYAPNARALGTARTIAAHTTSDALLAVDEPRPVRANPLLNSAREVEAASSHFTKATVLRHEEATKPALQAKLATKPLPPVWHFSCHGGASFAEPLESGLLLADNEMLTLRDLFILRLSGVRLAVLSACETGVPGTDLPDEVIGLPTGLTQAGVASVVASLWSVSDLSTMLLLVRFYDLWRAEGLVPAEALRQAQIWVRDSTNKEKANYFKGFLPEFASHKTSVVMAADLYQDLMKRHLNKRDFVDPYHWAAFGFTGV